MKKETIILEGVVMYRDHKMTDQWNKFSEKDYNLEIDGGKARVISQEPFSKGEVSRFNKLNPIGSANGKYFYQLTVNGNKAYFKIPYSLTTGLVK